MNVTTAVNFLLATDVLFYITVDFNLQRMNVKTLNLWGLGANPTAVNSCLSIFITWVPVVTCM